MLHIRADTSVSSFIRQRGTVTETTGVMFRITGILTWT